MPTMNRDLACSKLVQDLLSCAAVRRLNDIRFLGSIDYAYAKQSERFVSRLDHSIGVSELALVWIMQHDLCEHDRDILLASSLLHDVGHGPFSHSSEFYFSRNFNLTHHTAGQEVLFGQSATALELQSCLRDHKISPLEVYATAYDKTNSDLSSIFRGPINIDTIDGVKKAAAIFGIQVDVSSELLLSLSQSVSEDAIAEADKFWNIKSSVYKIIHNPCNRRFDLLIRTALDLASARVSRQDFGLTDHEFESKFSGEIEDARDLKTDSETVLQDQRERHVLVELKPSAVVSSSRDILMRYAQTTKGIPWTTITTSQSAVTSRKRRCGHLKTN